MTRCPQCDGPLERTLTEQSRTVGATTFVVRSPASACPACSAIFMSGEELQRVDLTVAAYVAVHGAPAGDTLRVMRKALGLRSLVLAELLEVSSETISRWENGQRPLDRNVWVLVGSLVLEQLGHAPVTVSRLVHAGKPLPATVRLAAGAKPSRPRAATPVPQSGRRRVQRVGGPTRRAGS